MTSSTLSGWLKDLSDAYRDDPTLIHCHRAHRISLRADGTLMPYNSWTPSSSNVASFLNFATGYPAQIYPPAFLARLREAGDGFVETCLKQDDIWLHLDVDQVRLPHPANHAHISSFLHSRRERRTAACSMRTRRWARTTEKLACCTERATCTTLAAERAADGIMSIKHGACS
jgi:hypothetical protein